MPTSSTFTDSLLYIHDGYETARWNFPAAVGTPKADPGGLGTAATVSYSFLTSVPSYFTTSGFRAFSSSEQQAAREALQGWSAVADIHFQEVSGVGAMTFGMNAQSGGSGYAYAPSYGYSYNGAGTITSVSASDLGGDVWINRNVAWTASDFQPGGFGLETLIHEIGHAVGLKHSFESDNGGAVLDPAYDHKGWTVMAYDEHPHGLFRTVTQNANGWTLSYRYIQPETPMIGDIAAIQQLYGANTAYHAGDDVYTFDPARPFLKTIWDGGGSDTISVSDFTERCVIDLTAGNFSSIRVLSDALPPGATETHADLYDGTDNLGIAYGVTIENATGGSGADRLLGNAAANVLKGNAGADTLLGKGGNDTLDGGTGADDLNGAAGNDTYVVDNTGDLVTEAADGGTDRVRSSVTWTLADQVENLTLTGTGKINGSGNGAANVLVGNDAANVLTGKGGADTLTGGGGADVFAFTGLGAADTVTDFVSGTDKLRLKASALPVGDGDTVVEGAVRIAGPGGFARTAELVIVTANIAGNLSAASAAAKIGSASAAYAVGDTALFVVDNGSSSALFYFQAADADKAVEANELTLLATLTGAASTAVGDFVFG